MATRELNAETVESLMAMAELRDKQDAGLYPHEVVPCYCGASSPELIMDKDRYGIPCRTNLCPACGVVYISPRMTADAYQSFYEQEYRRIYRTDDDTDPSYANRTGSDILTCCEFYDVMPSSVIDIGCGTGEVLRPFMDKGMVCLGVDHDPTAIHAGKARGLPIEVGTPDTLIQRGIKADLVLLNHVLEHALDLSVMLAQVRQLLTPTGVLFVALPGIHTTPLSGMFQLAHTYHFTADTLEYVMQCEGWQALMLTEQIVSFWKPTDRRMDKQHYLPRAAQTVLDVLGANPQRIPELKTHNKFPVKQQRENVQAVLRSAIPDFSAIRGRESGKQAIIIGGGPSVDGQLEQIHHLIGQGHRVVAIERMASWCHAHGIIPDYLSVLDASEDVPASLAHVHPETVCVTATQCGQAVVDALTGHGSIYVYNCPSGSLDLPTLFQSAVSDKQTVLNSGGSVTLSCMTIAMALGMSALHIFGFDCHVTGAHYATGITGVGEPTQLIDIDVEGRAFTTTGPYLSFAQQFFPLMDTGRMMGFLSSVTLYGDSLVLAMGEEWLQAVGLTPQTMSDE